MNTPLGQADTLLHLLSCPPPDFTAPICDLFVEIFQLKENNWLRRQAIVIILQQILGGTIERSVGRRVS
jgi:hypothetical protein